MELSTLQGYFNGYYILFPVLLLSVFYYFPETAPILLNPLMTLTAYRLKIISSRQCIRYTLAQFTCANIVHLFFKIIKSYYMHVAVPLIDLSRPQFGFIDTILIEFIGSFLLCVIYCVLIKYNPDAYWPSVVFYALLFALQAKVIKFTDNNFNPAMAVLNSNKPWIFILIDYAGCCFAMILYSL